jgi:hypothetical protein
MHFQKTFAAILSLAGTLVPSALCAAQLEADDFLVTALSSHYPSNTSTGASNSTAFLTFTIYDPDPVTNQTTTCGASWSVLNGSYPTDWTTCRNTTFSWYLSSFTNISTFTLEAQHSFIDPSVGQPPFDGVTTFGRGQFGWMNVSCTTEGDGSVDCGLVNGPAEVGIYAVAA